MIARRLMFCRKLPCFVISNNMTSACVSYVHCVACVVGWKPALYLSKSRSSRTKINLSKSK